MPGPAPKHPSARARRNNAKADFRTLDPNARKGKKAPAWPLQPDLRLTAELETVRDRVAAAQVELEATTDRRKTGRIRQTLDRLGMREAQLAAELEAGRDAEVELWEILWGMPQADIWEDTHSSREVAQYVRWKIRAEQGDLKAGTEARQLGDRLGLTPLALLKLRAEVEQVEAAEAQGRRRRESEQQTQPLKGVRRGKGKPEDPRQGLYAVS